MTDTTGGPQFYSAIQAKAMAAVQDTFKSQLYPVQYPAQGDFTWNWQNAKQVFNDNTSSTSTRWSPPAPCPVPWPSLPVVASPTPGSPSSTTWSSR